MAIPEFIQDLRVDIGTKMLPILGVQAVVTDARGRVLLGQRADNGRWAIPGGILDPGEEPAAGVVREILEETNVRIEVDYLASVVTSPPRDLANGDVIQPTTLSFRAHAVGGEARVNDDESLAVDWYEPDALPDSVSPRARFLLTRALSGERETWFARP